MVCKSCESKLGRVSAPDTWKAGARNTFESGGRKIGENKLLSLSKKKASQAFKTGRRCIECGQPVHQEQATRCHICAYSGGLCAICGVQILDTSSYRMTGGNTIHHRANKDKDQEPVVGDKGGAGDSKQERGGEKRKLSRAAQEVEKDKADGSTAKNKKTKTAEGKEEASGEVNKGDWVPDKKTGLLYHKTTKYWFDPKTKLYFHKSVGKWVKKPGQEKTA